MSPSTTCLGLDFEDSPTQLLEEERNRHRLMERTTIDAEHPDILIRTFERDEA
jgi:hypothetical protein